MFLKGVVDFALAQDAGDDLLRNLRVFGALLFILLAFLSRLLQETLDPSSLMWSVCPP